MANVIPTDLQLDVTLDSMLRGFKRRMIPILAFATVMRDVQLRGTNKVVVPYFPLVTDVSRTFTYPVGYVMDGSNMLTREVTIDRRKYQSLAITSEEWNRQPNLAPETIMELKGEKLAEDVLTDIFSVVTAANFGAPIRADIAAAAFDSDVLLEIRGELNKLHWPRIGRSIVLDTAYDTALMKDPDIKHYEKSGTTEPLRDGQIPKVAGFNYFESELIPENGERLVGIVAYMSALLAAFSPVEPHPDVRAQLTRYEIATDPDSLLSLEYRQWGSADFDTSKRVVECNYGFGVGQTEALKRITRPV